MQLNFMNQLVDESLLTLSMCVNPNTESSIRWTPKNRGIIELAGRGCAETGKPNCNPTLESNS